MKRQSWRQLNMVKENLKLTTKQLYNIKKRPSLLSSSRVRQSAKMNPKSNKNQLRNKRCIPKIKQILPKNLFKSNRLKLIM